MKYNKKSVALAAAALAFGATSAFAQTATTTTTTVSEVETVVTEEVVSEDVASSTTTETSKRTYAGFVQVPVETTTETTYTTRTGKPSATWSAADYYAPGRFTLTNTVSSDVLKVSDSLQPQNNPDETYKSEFGGIHETLTVDYDAPRLKFMFAPTLSLTDVSEHLWNTSDSYPQLNPPNTNGTAADTSASWYALNADDLALAYTGMNWFVEIRPFDMVSLNLHHDIYTAGSYLPVANTNVASGNLGSSGLTVMAFPVKNLRISGYAPIDFGVKSTGNYLDAEAEDYSQWESNALAVMGSNPFKYYKFNMGLGADYKFGNFLTAGVTLSDILNSQDMALGLHLALTPAKAFYANLGFTWNIGDNKLANAVRYDYFNSWDVGGEFQLNAAVGLALGKFDFGVDFVGGFGAQTNVQYPTNATPATAANPAGAPSAAAPAAKTTVAQDASDLYFGLKVAYALVPDTFNVGLRAAVGLDVITADNTPDTTLSFNPYATYVYGASTFGAGLVYEIALNGDFPYGGDTAQPFQYVKLPVYWSYKF